MGDPNKALPLIDKNGQLVGQPGVAGAPGLPGQPQLPDMPKLPGQPQVELESPLQFPGAPTPGAPPTAPSAKPPDYQQPPMDPLFQLLMNKSNADDLAALQARARNNTTAMMARYGTRLAMAGGGGSPLLMR